MICSLSHETRGAEDRHLFLISTKVLYVVGSISVFSDCCPCGKVRTEVINQSGTTGCMERHRLYKVQNGHHHPQQFPCFETAWDQGFYLFVCFCFCFEAPDTSLPWDSDFVMSLLVSTQSVLTLVLLMFISQINLSPECKHIPFILTDIFTW